MPLASEGGGGVGEWRADPLFTIMFLTDKSHTFLHWRCAREILIFTSRLFGILIIIPCSHFLETYIMHRPNRD